MFGLGRRLADLGIMGINRRNAEFTLTHNPRRYYPLVDDKLRTKEIALAAGIPVPELYGVARRSGSKTTRISPSSLPTAPGAKASW